MVIIKLNCFGNINQLYFIFVNREEKKLLSTDDTFDFFQVGLQTLIA